MTTQQLRLDPLALRVLRVLYELAQHDRPAHAGALSRELNIGRTLAADALVRLDRAGLVRAEHARLTMHGLVVAARLAPIALRTPSLVKTPELKSGRALSQAKEPRAATSLPTFMRATGS